LQRKGLNIVHEIELVNGVKDRLMSMKNSGCENFFNELKQFCIGKCIPFRRMDEKMPVRGRSRLHEMTYTKLHFYKVEILYVALDKICVEMNHRY
jgi:hypothetical protein